MHNNDVMVGHQGEHSASLIWPRIEHDRARETLAQAWTAGQRYFDTAPHYGAGLSEHRVGAFLAEKPSNEWVLSTKYRGRRSP